MSRADPEWIYQARRAATFRRLADAEHLDELDAEHLITAWEREAAMRPIEHLSREFWEEGDRWIADRQRDPVAVLERSRARAGGRSPGRSSGSRAARRR